jgi:hypothetical protein
MACDREVMLNHTRPQSPLAAHRGIGKSTLTHLFTTAVIRRRTFGVAPSSSAGKGSGRRPLGPQLRTS